MSTSTNRERGEALKIDYQLWKKCMYEEDHGFFPIWNEFKEFLSSDKLTGGALRLYLFIGIHAKNWTGESWYSVSRIAEELKCSERSVQEWAKELRDAGLISRFQLRFNSVAYTYLRPYTEDRLDNDDELEEEELNEESGDDELTDEEIEELLAQERVEAI